MMKRGLSLICAIAMVFSLCMFYVGEADLTVMATEEAEADYLVTDAAGFKDAVAKATSGQVIQLQNNIEFSANEYSYDKATGEITVTNGGAAVGTIGADGTVTGEVALHNEYFNLTLADGVTVDGNGYTISGLAYVGEGAESVSLFTKLPANSKVVDINFDNCVIVNKGLKRLSHAALIAYEIYGDVINVNATNITIMGVITLTNGYSWMGGLGVYAKTTKSTGKNVPTTLQGLYDIISGKDTTAKLVKTPTIANCRIDGDIVVSFKGPEASSSAATTLGGIVARTYGLKMYNCVNYADMTVKGAKCGDIGGILGLGAVDGDSNYTIGAPSSITIYNCANYGNMTFADGATMGTTGGIVGNLNCNDAFGADVSVVNCYNGGTTGSQGLFGNIAGPGRIAHPNNNGAYFIENTIPWLAYGYGGSAVNYSKTTAVGKSFALNVTIPTYGGVDEDGKALYDISGTQDNNKWVTDGKRRGNINFAAGEKISDQGTVSALYGKTNPTEILSITSKYLEGALPWVAGDDGYPTIDFTATRNEAGSKADPVIIDNATELKELRDVYNALKNVGYSIEINAKLGADIKLNEGVTFGYDSAKKVGTVTKDGTKYLVGSGIGNYAIGTFYKEDGSSATAPALDAWTPFASKVTSGSKTWAYYGKIILNLDGAGNKIDGLYINNTSGEAGFVVHGSNMVISNLTIDGLIVGSGLTGAFASTADSRFTLNDCVNEATVLSSGEAGGMVGRIGLQGGSDSLIDRLPNYVPSITGCVNKGEVVSATTAGGMAGVFNTGGDVSYNTNMGYVHGEGSNGGGIIGYINLNAQTGAGTKFGVTTPTWGYVKPYQFVLYLVGNSNSGSVTGKAASEIVPTVHNAWASNGAMVVKEGESYKVAFVLPSTIEAYGNVYKTTQSSTPKNAFETGQESQTLVINGTDLKGPKKTSAYKEEIFIQASTADAAGQISTLINTSKTSQFKDKGYMMWLDHDYDNGLVPHAIKAQADVEYSGTTITVNDKAGLMLINKTINDVTEKEANGYADINAAVVAATDGTDLHTKIVAYLQSTTGIVLASKDEIGSNLWLSQLKGFTVKIGKDIDLSGEEWTPLGNAANAYSKYANNSSARTITGSSLMASYGFRGTFDGNGKTISNFKLRTDAPAAFFATVISATIKNLTIDNLDVTSAYDLAVFALHSNAATFDNCDIGKNVNVNASTLMASGVVLVSNGGLIKNCENNAAKIYAQNQLNRSMGVAGIVGKNLYGTKIENCTNNGTIQGVYNNGIGGIVGYAEHLASGSAYIRNCVNNASITGWQNSISGGIIGNNAPWQANGQCYIEGNVNNGSVYAATNQAGGIVGALGGNATCKTNVRYNVNNGAVSSSSKAAGIAATTRAVDVVDANVNTGVVKLGGEDQTATYGIAYGSAVPTNSYSAGMNGTTADDIASGKVTALVNNAVGKVFSQNIGEEATPVPVALAKVVVYPEILTTVPATYEAGNGKAYVGYMDAQGNVYRPGATVDSVVGKPVTFTFYTAFGAGIRLGTPSGLRYTTFVNEAELEAFKLTDESFGTVIVPSSYVGTKGNNVQEIINSNCQKIDIANSGWYDKTDIAIPDGYKAYCGSVVNIKNQTMNFAGLSYVKITYADGEGYVTAPWQTTSGAETTSVSYSEAANARSIAYVANAIKADEAVYNNYSDTVKALIDGWAAQYVA